MLDCGKFKTQKLKIVMVNSLTELRATKHQVSTNLSGSTVILNHRDGFYYELNQVGTTIWEKLKSGNASFEELKNLVLDEYEVEESVATLDVNKIITELLNEKLLEVV